MKELLRINTKFYKIYNLIIRSEILIHSSLIISSPLENNYDVDISFGEIIKDDKKPLYDYGIFKYYLQTKKLHKILPTILYILTLIFAIGTIVKTIMAPAM